MDCTHDDGKHTWKAWERAELRSESNAVGLYTTAVVQGQTRECGNCGWREFAPIPGLPQPVEVGRE